MMMAASEKANNSGGSRKSMSSGGGRGVEKPPINFVLAMFLVVLGGSMVFLSFPPFNLFFLEWFALIPILFAVRGRGFWGAFFLGLIGGIVNNFGGFHWITDLLREFGHLGPAPSWAIAVLMALYQGLTMAFAMAIGSVIHKKLRLPAYLAYPIVYTAVEFLIPFIFPWYLANGQQRFYAVTQIVEITGVSGLTFLLVLVNTAMAEVLSARRDGRSFPVVAVFIATLLFVGNVGYGMIRIEQVDSEVEQATKLKVGMVEANVGIWEKEAKNPDGIPMDYGDQIKMLYANLLKHQFLSAGLQNEHHPDMIVWPESSWVPTRDVWSRRTDRVAVVTGRDGRMYYIAGDVVEPVEGEGVFEPMASGLYAIAAVDEDHLWAVGPRGAIFSMVKGRWTREAVATDRDLFAIAVAEGGEKVIAVGAQGTMLVREKGSWRAVESGTHNDLRGVVTTPDRGMVACGENGTLVAVGRGGAKSLVAPGLPDLLAVDWSKESGLVAVGRSGTVIRLDAQNHVSIQTPVRADLTGISAGNVVWAVGAGGEIVSCGDTCRAHKRIVRRDLVAVAGDSAGNAWAVGADGTILRLSLRGIQEMEGGRGNLVGIGFIPMKVGYPLDADVRHMYTSDRPLPTVGMEDPFIAEKEDSDITRHHRNAPMRGFSMPMIFGAITSEPDPRGGERSLDYNTALMIDSGGKVLGRYKKNYLLMFGEYIPFSDWFPFLAKLIPESSGFTPGEDTEVFNFKSARIGLMICYEDIIPSFTRRLAHKNPNLLVNVTNDAWFGKTAEPYLHLQLATFRSIENRRFLVRSTNTGVSAFVDPVGRIVAQTGLEDAETLVWDVALLEGVTPYQMLGDMFAWLCVVLALAMVGLAQRRFRLQGAHVRKKK